MLAEKVDAPWGTHHTDRRTTKPGPECLGDEVGPFVFLVGVGHGVSSIV
jgi:hypothetical protein